MNTRKSLHTSCMAGTVLALCTVSTAALAKPPKPPSETITLMQLQDVHGHIHPHAEIFPDGRKDPHSGGLAKLTTLINEVRAENPNNLLLAIGDTTHGSTETTFSLGDALMPWLNSLGIDAFTPGNWDFGYGPRVYKQRFAPLPPNVDADTPATKAFWLAPNNRTTIAWMDGMAGTDAYPFGRENQKCNTPGGIVVNYTDCHVTRANFDTVAINLYNYNEVAKAMGPPVHPGYVVKRVGGVNVGIIGITSDVVPQQAQAFNTSFRFTMGYKELPQAIAAAEADGAQIIVVLSELGLAKNVQLVKEFPEIKVMFSGHTHERTPEAIEIWNNGKLSLVTEAGEDSFLGQLDLQVSQGQITSYNWNLIEADKDVVEDEDVEEYVDEFRKTFVAGDDFMCHTFGTNAFPFGKGHTVCDPMETVVGHTDVTIQRWNALEDVSNNVMVDAFLDLAEDVAENRGETDSKGRPLTDANTLSTTNGFRFDVVIFGDDETLSDGSTANGDITLEDLYDYYPIGAATALAELTGGRLKLHWEGILNNVFDPNPYRQRGGWFLGFTHNMHFDINLSDDYPQSISAGKRIQNVTIDDGMGPRDPVCLNANCTNWDQGNPRKIDDSETYTLASCYPHGNPIDEVCRTSGATNLRFIQGVQEDCEHPAVFAGGIENCQLDVSSIDNFHIVEPVNTQNIWDPVRFKPGNNGPLFLKVAPDNFVHPIDALRRYLAKPGVTVNLSDHGLGRVEVVGADPLDPRRGVPVSEYGGAGIVQPTQGVGPEWLKREIVE
jgi:sulfur-oxidizing protein SoxB